MRNLLAEVVEAGFKACSAADDNDGEIVEGMVISFAEFVDPNDGGMVEHVSITVVFRGLSELSCEVGELLCKPDVNFLKFVLGVLVFVGLV